MTGGNCQPGRGGKRAVASGAGGPPRHRRRDALHAPRRRGGRSRLMLQRVSVCRHVLQPNGLMQASPRQRPGLRPENLQPRELTQATPVQRPESRPEILQPNGLMQASPGQRPGIPGQWASALKGRHIVRVRCFGLSGLARVWLVPRALPWAGLSGALGAESSHAR